MAILAHKNSEKIAEAILQVDSVDLSRIHLNLRDEMDGPGWSEEKCVRIENQYRQVLVGRILFPDIVFAPSKDVDVFWHYHILDTRKYMQDCSELFGYYLHHEAYLGMEGPESEAALLDAWKATQELRELLGTPREDEFAGAGAYRAYCGAGTSPAYCGAGAPPNLS